MTMPLLTACTYACTCLQFPTTHHLQSHESAGSSPERGLLPLATETNSNGHKKVCMNKNRPYSTCARRVYNAASTNACIVWGLAFDYPVPRLMHAICQAMILCAVLHKLTRYLCSPPSEEVGRPMYRSV